jgi:hypothetical protein
MTTSQCSKSRPSSTTDSLSWRWQFLQSADESLSDEVAGRVANPLAAAQGAAAGDGPSADRRRLSAAEGAGGGGGARPELEETERARR